jgi:sugar phosphate isomerase/epimerase
MLHKTTMLNRRTFVRNTILATGSLAMPSPLESFSLPSNIKISLAQWSLHRTLEAGKMDNLEFPAIARNKYGIEAVEYVNQFFGGKQLDYKAAAKNEGYLKQLLQRSKDAGVYNHLIMVDNEGSLAIPKESERLAAVENHKKWIDAAKFLGCATVRVNLHGEGNSDDKHKASVDSLGRLGSYASASGINVVVENHGGDSSNGKWISAVMKEVGKSNVGTLPDFGNFCINHPWGQTQDPCSNMYDRATGVKEMLPFAKGVSAKTYDFDEKGDQSKIDYPTLMGIVKSSGFTGYIGIEYEGYNGNEDDGIKKTKALLEKYL